MSDLTPIAFDIETSGLDEDAIVTVAGFCHPLRTTLYLTTEGRPADESRLEAELAAETSNAVELTVCESEAALLEAIGRYSDDCLDGETHYLTAYNGERWNGGFDLPFLRDACIQNTVRWPFGDIAYADMMDALERIDTYDTTDLEGVYEALVGRDSCDPFADSSEAVTAFETGTWLPLLKHNLADIQRTLELARVASQYVPQSDFSMKNLKPPER